MLNLVVGGKQIKRAKRPARSVRPIKFKGMTKSRQWLFGDLIHRANGLAIRPIDMSSNPYGFRVLDESVGQFTGCTDARGTELYEGDCVVKHYLYDTDEPDDDEYWIAWDADDAGFAIVTRSGGCEEWLDSNSAKGWVAIEDRRWTKEVFA